MVLFAECLELQSEQFQAATVKIRRKMWWKNIKVFFCEFSFSSFFSTMNRENVHGFFPLILIIFL